MAEVWAWPEGRLWIYSANAVSPDSLAYVERVELVARYDWRRTKFAGTGWANQGQFFLADKHVEVSFGQMYAESTWALRAQSATSWHLAFSAESIIASGSFQIWSAVFQEFRINGSRAGLGDGLIKFAARMEGLDFSAT